MLRHHDRFKLSSWLAANQHRVTQPSRHLPVWGLILVLALTTLACGLSSTASDTSVQRVVILNRLPTLTPTPRQSSSSGRDAADANSPLPPTAIPAANLSANVSEASEPASISLDPPLVAPPPANDWLFTNVQLYPDQAEGLQLFGELTNNSGASQTLTEVTGTFYDAQGQVIADHGNTIGYWPVDNIPSGGRVPFELLVEGIDNAANFDLNVTAEPGSASPRQDFEFGELNQRTEADTYCLTGQFRNPGADLQHYLVLGATLYDAQDNIVNFGDYYQSDLQAVAANRPLEFEICIAPPYQGTARYELWAWGE